MAKISDELRRQANCIRSLNSKTHTYKDPCKIERLADRIDAEMVELPKDADGVPIHVGDMLRGCDAVLVNVFTTVVEMRFNGRWEIDTTFGSITEPRLFVHDYPDSLERIADEMEGLSVDSMTSDTNLLSSCALDLAKRIRRLAEREG